MFTIRRNSKSGCGTCKARKVKCDEGKPVCSRCRTTGRTCEGYGIWGGGGNSYAERYVTTQPTRSPLPNSIAKPPTKAISHEELRYLQLYRIRVVHTTSGWFGSQFWYSIVLPAASSEPAILHAAIALSAAHRCNFGQEHAPDVRERFILQQYSKAIGSLQPLMRHYDRASISVVLIACQLFAFLEYIRGKHSLAGIHLRNGLSLIKGISTDNTSSQHGVVLGFPSRIRVLDKAIVQSFANVHMLAGLFGHSLQGVDVFLQSIETDMPDPTFSNPQAAKESLVRLLHRIVLISQRFREKGVGDEDDWSALSVAKEQINNLLATWYETYLRTVPEIETRTAAHRRALDVSLPLAFGTQTPSTKLPILREPTSYKLLLMYHAMATIMCKSLGSHFESRYEAYTNEFISILEHAVDLFHKYALALAIPGNINLHHSIAEFGFIPPLYYTAIKCRVHRIRLHAIMLLRQIPIKEVTWDSSLTANIAQKVVELEEQGVYCGLDADEEFPLFEAPRREERGVLREPESNLFHDVQVKMLDDFTSKAVITCKRWRVDGSLETLICHITGGGGLEDEGTTSSKYNFI
ncbi:hypothetical protein EJ02DRAFT_17603 [Clathrospora elynae]|uniref:Zn(2)-C6 fungal-type domain-containing protein n=1 Tax=Clathrospora elynae TaxID=706981 RepID=A0A6A5SF64_9PLEO|nr:hypothetical protein EJ02DRAFT_17603 [Clathrospora elynae]